MAAKLTADPEQRDSEEELFKLEIRILVLNNFTEIMKFTSFDILVQKSFLILKELITSNQMEITLESIDFLLVLNDK